MHDIHHTQQSSHMKSTTQWEFGTRQQRWFTKKLRPHLQYFFVLGDGRDNGEWQGWLE
jgi:hypothetical protein